MVQETREQYEHFAFTQRLVSPEVNPLQLRAIAVTTLASHLEGLLSYLGIQTEEALYPTLDHMLFQSANTEMPRDLRRQIEVTEAVRVSRLQGLQSNLETALETHVADSSDFTRRMA